jgi:hypothetical protein
MYNFGSYVHDSLCIESLACQNLPVNDAVLGKEIREVAMLSSQGNKIINLTCH